jgi:hypothetical protein
MRTPRGKRFFNLSGESGLFFATERLEISTKPPVPEMPGTNEECLRIKLLISGTILIFHASLSFPAVF